MSNSNKLCGVYIFADLIIPENQQIIQCCGQNVIAMGMGNKQYLAVPKRLPNTLNCVSAQQHIKAQGSSLIKSFLLIIVYLSRHSTYSKLNFTFKVHRFLTTVI